MRTADDILRMRLNRQLIESSDVSDPAEVVRRLGAMQAQDYPGVLWAVGLRTTGSTAADVERSIAERHIVRTWPIRGTLHLVAPQDARWMLGLLAQRAIDKATTRHSQLGLTDAVFARARELFEQALSGGRSLTRTDAMALLEADGIATTSQRGYHILWFLAQNAVLCIGPMEGKQQTFVLFDEWIGPATEPPLDRIEALARLASRYFAAHGPATSADLAWWAGITKNEARIGLEAIQETLDRIEIDDVTYWMPAGTPEPPVVPSPAIRLLPGFDEYMLGYTDRELQLGDHRETYRETISANGMFSSTIVIDGQISGTWKRTHKHDRVEIGLRTFRTLETNELEVLADTAARYGEFLGKETLLTDWRGSEIR